LTFTLKKTVHLAKLHGSADGDIIAPTRNKSSGDDIQHSWTLARQLREKANHSFSRTEAIFVCAVVAEKKIYEAREEF